MSDILVLLAHPRLEHSRVSRALLDAAQRAAQAGAPVAVRDLYALYPDYVVDVAAEQAALDAARLVVWVHPVHWYGMPPLLRLWQDEVLAFGWAYGGGEALRDKSLWLVTSTGGGPESYRSDGYNRHDFADFLPPYTQTAALCGLCWQAPMVLHGAHRIGDAELGAFAERFGQRLTDWPDGAAWRAPGDAAADRCAVPVDARPKPPQAGEWPQVKPD